MSIVNVSIFELLITLTFVFIGFIGFIFYLKQRLYKHRLLTYEIPINTELIDENSNKNFKNNYDTKIFSNIIISLITFYLMFTVILIGIFKNNLFINFILKIISVELITYILSKILKVLGKKVRARIVIITGILVFMCIAIQYANSLFRYYLY